MARPRKSAPPIFVGGWALEQLWLFWLAPVAGGVAAGLLGAWLHEEDGPPDSVR